MGGKTKLRATTSNDEYLASSIASQTIDAKTTELVEELEGVLRRLFD